MNRPIIAAAAAVIIGATGLTYTGTAHAQEVPGVMNCGGQADVKLAPVHCGNTRTIDGTLVTVILDVTDSTVTASYTLDAPRPTDTALRLTSNRGISTTPRESSAEGVIPAGALTATLTTRLLCGQVDAKAVFTGPGDARGRVAGPFVTNSVNCIYTQTIVPPPASSTPSVPPAAPPATTPGSPLSPGPGAPFELPATGQGINWLAAIAAALILTGTLLRLAGVRRP